jgi:serine/threonine-protein kinase
MGKTMVELTTGELVADRYRVIRVLGTGGMGTVYLVKHIDTDERLALKILHHGVADDEVARERFRREARAPARIDSDHVARVYDTGVAVEAGDAPFLVMEHLRGDNLQRISESVGPLPKQEVVIYMQQVARALDKAHSIGIVHRDMKPENVFLTMREDGTPFLKVLDFGIAKLTGAAGDLERIKATSTGDVFGTPLYMSPEQCLSEIGTVGPASDIWSLGLIAHRMLTGDHFWQASNLTHLIGLIAYERIPKPSAQGCTLGKSYDAWFARCCARDPKKRYASASAAVEALAEALDISAETPLTASGQWLALDQAKQVEAHQFALTADVMALTASALAMTQADPSTQNVASPRRGLLVAVGAAALVLGGLLAWLAPLAGTRGGAAGSTTAGPTAGATAGPTASPIAAAAQPAAPPPEKQLPLMPSGAASAALTAATASALDPPEIEARPSRRATPRRRPRTRAAPAAPAVTATPAAPTSPVTAAPIDPLADRH